MTLKAEQQRIARTITATSDSLAAIDADTTQWQQTLTLAGQIATRCGIGYQQADNPTRRLYNNAIFNNITIKDGRIATTDRRPPFDQLLAGGGRFESQTLVEVRGLEPLASSVRGRRSTRLSYTPRKAQRTYHEG